MKYKTKTITFYIKNKLMVWGIILSILSFISSIASYILLLLYVQEQHYFFGGIVAITLLTTTIITSILFVLLYKVKHKYVSVEMKCLNCIHCYKSEHINNHTKKIKFLLRCSKFLERGNIVKGFSIHTNNCNYAVNHYLKNQIPCNSFEIDREKVKDEEEIEEWETR